MIFAAATASASQNVSHREPVMRPGNDPAFRETTFGAGLGFLSFYVDNKAEVIRIFQVVWAG